MRVSGRIAAIRCALGALGLAVFTGCATRTATPAPQPPPKVTAHASAGLSELVERRQAVAAELATLESDLKQFQAANPNLSLHFDLSMQEVRLLSERRLNAELAVIEARSTYAPEHPQVDSARRREAELNQRYVEALVQLTALRPMVDEYERLTVEVQSTRAELRRLDERMFEMRIQGR